MPTSPALISIRSTDAHHAIRAQEPPVDALHVDSFTRSLAAPPASLTRSSILGAGGVIDDVPMARREFAGDLAVLARDPEAGKNHWKAFLTSRERLGPAFSLFDLEGLAPEQRMDFVLPSDVVEARTLRPILDTLYFKRVDPLPDDCPAIARALDFLGPQEEAPWQGLMAQCQETFARQRITDGNWSGLLDKLAHGGPACRGWADPLATFVGASPARVKAALSCKAAQMQLLLASRALPLNEPDRLQWLVRHAERHAARGQSVADYLQSHGLTGSIRWTDVGEAQLFEHGACLTDAQFRTVARARMATALHLPAPQPPFGGTGGGGYPAHVGTQAAEPEMPQPGMADIQALMREFSAEAVQELHLALTHQLL